MARMRKKLGSRARGRGRPQPDPHRMRRWRRCRRRRRRRLRRRRDRHQPSLRRRQLLAVGRQPAAGLPGVRRQVPSRRTPISMSRSPSTAGTTTGASSPTASWPATHPTSSPTTCPSTRSSSTRSSWSRWTTRSTKDGFNVNQYQEGLADLWMGQDGKRYGLPKDFDTVAIFYNKKLIDDAGVKEADLQNLTWNPDGRRHLREDDRPPDRRSRAASAATSQASTSPRSRSTAWDSTAARAAASDRPSGACTPAPTAGSSPTRIRGAPTTTTTSPHSRTPSAGSPR